MILGILAATALPKFIDLSGEASTAAVGGVAGALSSAASINYGARKASAGAKGIALTAANVCTDTATTAGGLMQGGAMPANYTFDAAVTGNCSGAAADGTSVTCKINGQNGKTANATVICVN